ncbi:MAG: RnfABCDGE type electron transport complex subunit D [Clostridia bacterium]|nr:RnfABCDGE type electron transport complex subunit D [Clostridia bacterium]
MPVKKKGKKKKNTYYSDMCFALFILLTIACHFHGIKALSLFAVSVLSALIFDCIGCKVINRKFKIKNCHAIFIGGLTALMLPASAPLWLPVAGCAFSVFMIKIPFGSLNLSPFSAVAAGIAFLSICRPDLVFDYQSDSVGSISIAQSLSRGTPIVTAIDLINAFIGSVPGAMGTTCTVAMLGLLIFVILKRPKNFLNSFAFLFTCFIGAVIITAVNSENFFTQNVFRVICLRMCSGFTLCMAVFFVTEDSLLPKKNIQRILYGMMMGVVYIILNRVGTYEDAGCFAVLLTNAFWPVIKKYIFTAGKVRTEVVANEPTESLT